MNSIEYSKLKLGDKCEIIRGHDEGRQCEVVFMEGEAVVVRACDGKRFNPLSQYDRLKLTSYRELRLIKD